MSASESPAPNYRLPLSAWTVEESVLPDSSAATPATDLRSRAIALISRATRAHDDSIVHLRPWSSGVAVIESFGALDLAAGLDPAMPYTTAEGEGAYLLEWWGRAGRKLSVYVSADGIDAVKVWGRDPQHEMDSVAVTAASLRNLWAWIRGFSSR